MKRKRLTKKEQRIEYFSKRYKLEFEKIPTIDDKYQDLYKLSFLSDQLKSIIDLIQLSKIKNISYFNLIEKELQLVFEKNLSHIYLQVHEILSIIKKMKVPYFIRGSANSSILCYILGITNIDPIQSNMAFARFLNKTRQTLPDIDIDVPHIHRDKIFSELAKYFCGRIARISNHVKFRKKSAFRKVLQNNPTLKIAYSLDPDYFQNIVEEKAKNLEGEFNYYSLHCGGVVIFPDFVDSNLVVYPKKIPTTNLPQIKYNKDQLEDNGLLKIDILSNRAFTQLISISDRDIDSYPHRDAKTAKVLCGNIFGLTLAESPLVRQVCKNIQPKTRNELAIVLALVRPASSDIRSGDLSKKNLKEEIVFDDDAIAFIKNILPKITDDDADMYRRGFAKQKQSIIQSFMRQFNKERTDLSDNEKKKIICKLDSLRHYGFCKGHATAFAHLVWGLAYQKAHNPKQFWVSTLTHTRGSYNRWVWYRDAKINGKIELSFSLRRFPEWDIIKNKLVEKDSNKYQTLIHSDKFSIEEQFNRFGYWLNNQFYPNCYFEKNGKTCFFKGLIAIGKRTKDVTYLTIGYDNDKFLDLVVSKSIDWGEINLIEGVGEIIKNNLNQNVISVDQFRLF